MQIETSTFNVLLGVGITGTFALLGWMLRKLVNIETKLVAILATCPLCRTRPPKIVSAVAALVLLAFTPLNAAGDRPVTLAWDWLPTVPPAEFILFSHTTDLSANPDPQTWPVIRVLPGFTVTPAPPAGSSLNLTYSDASGTNWFAVYWTTNSTFATNQIVPAKSTTFTINPTSSDFFAVRSSNTWAGVGPFSNVAGVNGPPGSAVLLIR